ncbi:50S ribosome-binding protein YggL [uncultured Rikenella sp.]|uniref:50S ribosome-binding protein YggL n=1 Tax=uncultured Rikenella sp. TaxID=368003 RepID=UPI00272D8263|nr:50S ribosome-binding protein YggL [uncultured Rikenella sp.]
MKKRLRKKFRKGEFAEFGFEVDFDYSAVADSGNFTPFWDEFVDRIESLGLCCGGGGAEHQSYFIDKPGRGSVSSEQRQALIDWLTNRSDVTNVVAGELRDAWYGRNE